MPDARLSFLRRPSLRKGAALAATVGVIAVGFSAGVAVADDHAPAPVAAAAPIDLPGLPGLPALPELPPLPGLPAPEGFLPAPPPVYENNLDGWIRQSLDIMRMHGIPGSYEGIHRNIMRESGGNPKAINLSDSNAAKGTPSKGLLQVIDPTFNAYHVDGTAFDIWDPVANITAACNYAAHRYGSMDNVNGAY
ncbi:transglycosylase SLT domain-containing protein [Nocardia implantans]|uniref:Transglycosylase SLT domain-containing protein n=1 Tax=Nocardia implantans TaxID=3108168 RepID=A0ABU6AQS1_9NOCA|nr:MULTISPECIES: transglycosylase SLT domain-containing protein [unclassified Nocardia]MBF6190154.1 transglycosylase SLT domain-containing protein [Nocardia beijingensis]MEA3526613.1 transglycosylase SLT domain-containing protein [Nocardia sp. CDC192]MEB3509810.1 transglycosylase SLT domain-containing protein [Nocardia sp. CDC186]